MSKLSALAHKIRDLLNADIEIRHETSVTITHPDKPDEPPPPKPEDIAAVLDKKAAAKGEKLNWRTSIVDLLKVTDGDPSFEARAALAKEVGMTSYTGTPDQNVELHGFVLDRLEVEYGLELGA